jgi:hypothetical protein
VNFTAAAAILVLAILNGCGGEQSASEREGGNLSVATGGTAGVFFYYAVLSEVSPPTALSAFAAAAITGGNPFRTMM